jgi:hypothetical protein
MLNRKALFVVITVNLWIVSYMVVEFFFIRYLHYHSQNQFLNPADYDVEVLLPSDYENLSNPNNQQIILSNGNERTLPAKGREYFMTKYKVIDSGRYYVLTTLKGTAPFFIRWTGDFIVVFTGSITSLIAGIKVLRSNRAYT